MNARVEFAFRLSEQAALNGRLCRKVYGALTRPAMVVGAATLAAACVFAPTVAIGILAPPFMPPTLVISALLALWLPGLAIRRLNLALTRRAVGMRTLEGASCILEARPEHLLWVGPGWRSEIAWSGIDLIDDGPRAVMIVFCGVGYYAPRRAFPDEETRRAFIQECAKYLTSEALRRSGLD